MKLLPKDAAVCVASVYIWVAVLQLQWTAAQRSSMLEIARQSRLDADKDVDALERSTRTGIRLQNVRRRLTSRHLLNTVHGGRRMKARAARRARLFDRISRSFAERARLSISDARASASAVTPFQAVMSDVCKPQPVCSNTAKYRTEDGSCNNLKHPMWGMASTPQRRELNPEYSDNMGKPRIKGNGGHLLPSARAVSVALHRASRTPRDPEHTVLLMQWGQFLDHDLTITPAEAGPNGEPLDCCAHNTSEACFPISLEPSDPNSHFAQSRCMEFTRSLPAVDPECKPSRREQLNELTAYIDGSQVYGSSAEEMNLLRTKFGGKLNTSDVINLPEDPGESGEGCIIEPASGDHCPIAGDARVIEHAGLGAMHTVFLREHNRIAGELERVNPKWNDETIFQETRKIVAAIMQHITYNEFLPAVLGPFVVRTYKLKPKRRGFDNVYNDTVDASISNAFAAAAYRFGHSMIPDKLGSSNTNFQNIASTNLEKTFFNPFFLYRHTNGLSRWMASTQGFKVDRKIDLSVSDKLFLDSEGKSLDLPALNIQRGRDHGLPPYFKWRRLCNPHRRNFRLRLSDHDRPTIRILDSVYNRRREDIDLFSGGVSEKPSRGAIVGPTFACIIARQFQRLKTGDRFYYENNRPKTGFSTAQLREIKKVTLSKVLCVNMDIPRIQPEAFKRRYIRNRLKTCSSLPTINLNAWREASTVRPPGSIYNSFGRQRPIRPPWRPRRW